MTSEISEKGGHLKFLIQKNTQMSAIYSVDCPAITADVGGNAATAQNIQAGVAKRAVDGFDPIRPGQGCTTFLTSNGSTHSPMCQALLPPQNSSHQPRPVTEPRPAHQMESVSQQFDMIAQRHQYGHIVHFALFADLAENAVLQKKRGAAGRVIGHSGRGKQITETVTAIGTLMLEWCVEHGTDLLK